MQNLQNIMKSVGKLPTGGFPAATRLGAATQTKVFLSFDGFVTNYALWLEAK
jgi:hypothetical protein